MVIIIYIIIHKYNNISQYHVLFEYNEYIWNNKY